jgi:hypothetical protein
LRSQGASINTASSPTNNQAGHAAFFLATGAFSMKP